jgi:hypothetical protein
MNRTEGMKFRWLGSYQGYGRINDVNSHVACFDYIQQKIYNLTFHGCFYISVKWLGCGGENYYSVLVLKAKR